MRVDESDYNLLHNPKLDLATAPLFPGGLTLAAWQKGNASEAAITDAPKPGPKLVPPFVFPPRDVHSLVGDPLFVGDPYDGAISDSSPAVAKLGFQQLPNIEDAAPRLRRKGRQPP